METIKKTIIEEEVGTRIDKYIALLMPEITRTRIQQLITDGHVLANGKPTKNSYKVQLNDELNIEIPEDKELEVEAENIPLDIVYEDEDIIVVNKANGMIVHPSAGVVSGTLVNALLYHCKDLSGINGVIRPGIVHRIDKETTGLLVVAKNDFAHKHLSEQLKDHSVARKYIAIVHGEIPHEYGTIDAPIGRDTKDRQKMMVTDHNSKRARTNFKVIEYYKGHTLIECRLETGRTHQIRVHLNYIKHPVLGDPKYGYRRDDTSFGQYLHAQTLGFIHPTTNEEMEFEAPLPKEFVDMIEMLKERSK